VCVPCQIDVEGGHGDLCRVSRDEADVAGVFCEKAGHG